MYRDSRKHGEERRVPGHLQTEIDHFLKSDRNQTSDSPRSQPIRLGIISPFTETSVDNRPQICQRVLVRVYLSETSR